MIKHIIYIAILFCILPFISVKSVAQLVASGYIYEDTTSYTSYPTNHSIYLYSDLTSGSLSVSSSTNAYSYNWYTYSSGSWSLAQSGNSNSLNDLQETGYKVDELNQNDSILNTYFCWTFQPSIDSCSIDTTSHTCSTLSLTSTVYTETKTYYDLITDSAINLDYSLTYTWSSITDDDISEETSSSPSITAPVEETVYTLIAQAFEGALSDTTTITIEPKAVEADYDVTIVDRDYENEIQALDSLKGSTPFTASFESTSKGDITDYEYDFTREATDDDEEYTYAPHLSSNTTFTFTEYGTYDAALTVTNDDTGCSDTKTESIYAYEMDVDVPNVFTPNGDGINDEFMVVYKSIKNFHMSVFNRAGRKVFYTTNPGKSWDGTIGGSKAAEGVYFYYIEAKGYNEGERTVLKGTVTLLR